MGDDSAWRVWSPERVGDDRPSLSLKSLVWVTRSFLDYRIPVYAELSRLVEGGLTVIYNGDYVPDRAQQKLREALGPQAVGLRGELRIGARSFSERLANKAIRFPWQPGLLKEIRRCRPDVLISDGFFQWTAPCLWLHARAGLPHVMCYERTAHTERQAQWYRKLYRDWALRHIDAISCSGRLCGEYVRALGHPPERITYGHMVADVAGLQRAVARVRKPQLEDLRKEHEISGLAFLYVGSLIERKGIRQLLCGWNDFHRSITPGAATLILVGDGPERATGEAYCQSNRIASVRFAGAVDYDSLPEYYAIADCFVIPTLEDNWSLVVPEAMACGLPILCSRYNGCWPELVHEGRNGWVFDPLDCSDIARVLRAAFAMRAELPRFREESRQIVSEHTAQRAASAILKACRTAWRVRGFAQDP